MKIRMTLVKPALDENRIETKDWIFIVKSAPLVVVVELPDDATEEQKDDALDDYMTANDFWFGHWEDMR